MFKWLRRALCAHHYDLADLTARDANGNVSCACYLCGKVNTATFGLGLPGTFNRNSKIDCAGSSPCSTCPDRRKCGVAGCIRIAAQARRR